MMPRRLLVIVAAALGLVAACSSSAPELIDARSGPERLTYGDDPAQFGVLTMPTTSARATDDGLPVIVLIHGGFWSVPWDLTLMDAVGQELSSDGYAIWNIEFRRAGGAGGYPQTLDDVAAAIDQLAELGATRPLDLGRVVLVGHSSGGHLALWALDRTAEVAPSGAVGLGAVTDLAATAAARDLLGGSATEVPDRYADAAPVLDPTRVRLVHGALDRIVAAETLAGAEAAGVPITLVDGEGHFESIEPGTDSWDAARAAIDDLLE